MHALVPLKHELAVARETLAKHLPWSPLDYVPGISRDADRAMYAEQLTAPLSEEDDLRFRGALPEGEPLAVFAQRLPWDTQFFGYGVARLDGVFPLTPPLHRLADDYTEAVAHLCETARSRGIQYLFAQVDPRDLALLRALGRVGFTLLETRLHYHFSVQVVHYLRRPDHVPMSWSQFRLATHEDIPSLSRVAREAVNPYDRFHADPFIRRSDVDRLMEEWVKQSVLGNFADLTVVPDVREPTAFITYRLHKKHWARWGLNLVQVVFSAVSPEMMGWFTVVGPELNNHLSSLGAQHCFGKTQMVLGLDGVTQFGKGEHVFRIIL